MLNKFLLASIRRLGALGSAVLLTIAAICFSLVIYTLLASLQGTLILRGLVNAFIIPAVVAPPISFIFFRLLQRLDETERRLRQANQELLRLASVDGLTLVANRRRMDEYLEQEWRRSRREGWPLSVVICDVDRFKEFNDRHGHPAGDKLLQAVAGLITDLCRRPADLTARYGGDEFVALLPNTDLDGAAELAQIIRRKVGGLALGRASAGGGGVSVSCGVAATSLSDDHSAHQVLDRADRALYRAKHQGRDRVEVDRLGSADSPDPASRHLTPDPAPGNTLPH